MTAFFSRLKNLLLSPATEFGAIAEEPLYDAQEVVQSYALPLLVAGMFVQVLRLGITLPSVIASLVSFALMLLMLFVTATLVSRLAPGYAAPENRLEATRLVVYASTPIWVGRIFAITDSLTLAGFLFAFYSAALYSAGLPALMKVRADKHRGYTMAVFFVVAALLLFIGAVIAGIDNVAATANRARGRH